MSLFFNLISKTNIRALIQPQLATRYFHSLTKNTPAVQFLTPTDCNLVQSAGFKVRGKLRKRCKDCYFVRREQRLFIICNTHKRHKQMQMVKDERNTWMLSHATQGKIRPW